MFTAGAGGQACRQARSTYPDDNGAAVAGGFDRQLRFGRQLLRYWPPCLCAENRTPA